MTVNVFSDRYIFITTRFLVASAERANNGIAESPLGLGILSVTLLPAATVSVTVPDVFAILQQFAKLLLYALGIVPVN